MDVVRIAESYFLRMLFDLPAKEAVRELSSEWRRRASLGGQQALSAPERLCDLVNGYTFLVRMGGHWLFFCHTPRDEIEPIIGALDLLELNDTAQALRSALARCVPYPSPTLPAEAFRRARFVSDDIRFADLDRSVWAHPIDGVLLQYLRQNKELLLLPERGIQI